MFVLLRIVPTAASGSVNVFSQEQFFLSAQSQCFLPGPKNEITSYRHLDRILKEPQNQSYRNFISVGGSQRIPSHNSMSDFRTKVGVERFYQILFHVIAQALKLDGFLNPVISAVDSRPLFANVGDYYYLIRQVKVHFLFMAS